MKAKQKTWAGLAFGGLFAVMTTGLILSASVSAQGNTTAAPAGSMPNLDPSKLPAGVATRGARTYQATCTGCHGVAGVSTQAMFPRLAGQHSTYLTEQLLILRAGIRPSQIMNRVAAKLSDQNISDLAAYLSAQKVGDAWTGQNAALAGEGAKIFGGGAPERGVIACGVCHGAQGLGVSNLSIALVRHQSPGYATDVMHEFQKLGTTGTPQSTAMYLEMKPLSDHEIDALAAYLSTMP
ncbi:cytochrome c4 (plasmid) [Deinococcus sp. KNUC1210]|uniref:c-type cytochrome n=1 Tax=Deinococcus sp. KNUC1210 TaxID=2917691 RepID=UPI001EF14921|nr:cytochrome c4 [Deinococcus sp. KNUC1210]ULH14209.1 cytochrome c4 [Deinococcus sp. KNUC1210]